MLRLPIVLVFVAVSLLSWGLYGPVLHIGQDAMGHSLLRPLICVGMAYFLIAVIAPGLLLRRTGEAGRWTVGGAIWSFLAGAAGAVGALGIVAAFQARGRPIYVMPLVFGCAPVVNTLVTMWMTRTAKQASMLFYTGILLVAIGSSGVLFFAPKSADEGPRRVPPGAASQTQPESSRDRAAHPLLARELFTIIGGIAVTALCWGSYGPVLHKGQAKMAGSRLRPFLCVGLAYFLIAVILPTIVLMGWREPGRWSLLGSLWSLGAGAFGALGALGIIMAFNFGGKPIYVMPLVFGGAPVVNTLTSIARSVARTGSAGQFPWPFYPSLLLVIVGAVVVLVFAPRPRPEIGRAAQNHTTRWAKRDVPPPPPPTPTLTPSTPSPAAANPATDPPPGPPHQGG